MPHPRARKIRDEPNSEDTNAQSAHQIPVVGIGASAGGLEAFKSLLAHLPDNTGMAFVLIQHLDPKHESLLPQLLSRSSALPIEQARDNTPVEPDHVYIIPPNRALGIHHGVLQVLERVVEGGKHLPVDYFMRVLSEDQGNWAIGVILSGTASDGTGGLKAIKANGGVTFAQDKASAEYFGMPGSAIAAGCVDYVMSPAKIAEELGRISRHPYLRFNRPHEARLPEYDEEHLAKVFMLLRSRTGNDFTHYKRSTVLRRIKRRMLVHKLERIPEYFHYLQSTPDEPGLLFQDLLINVTSFFRDPDSFTALQKKVIPGLLSERGMQQSLRVWIPGCSTGEEVYSLAITLLELLGERNKYPQLQIFATDIDQRSIETARSGVYPESIVNEVSQSRLHRFFVQVKTGYQVNKSVRDNCVFAVQNVIKDPPFSKMDLVCCRNLLIYLGPVLQKRALELFHYALQPSGFLMLGTSESVAGHAELFEMVDRKNKIYAKKSIASRLVHDFNTDVLPSDSIGQEHIHRMWNLRTDDLHQEAERLILAKYGPPGVTINRNMEILHFHGENGPYLNPLPGTASLNLLKLVRQEFAMGLRAAVNKSLKEGVIAGSEGIGYRRNGTEAMVNIRVLPMRSSIADEHNLLVLFEEPPFSEKAASLTAQEKTGSVLSSEEPRILDLEHELTRSRANMQAVIEELEGANEELKAANEEIQSTNEELQSTNEELETAKEELQSTNEELATVNEELENRNEDLSAANNDLTNLLSNVNLPILMLSQDMHIRQFTPQAEKLLNLISTDLDRPISDIKTNIEIPDLAHLVRDVVDSMSSKELELQDNNSHWHSVRIRPYKTIDNRIDGVVITFVNVDTLKDIERLNTSLKYEARLATVVRDANDAITVQSFDGKVSAWNPAATRVYGYPEKEALGMDIRRLIPKDRLDEYLQTVEDLKKGVNTPYYDTTRIKKNGDTVRIGFTATALIDRLGIPYAVATTERLK